MQTFQVSSAEVDLVEYHVGRFPSFTGPNKVKEAYYDGKKRIANLGISLPPELQHVEAIVGWPGTVVDVLEERLNFLGWGGESSDDPLGLSRVYTDNALAIDSSAVHLDALITGSAFLAVGSGYAGEPSPLITVESPMTMTGHWDARLRRLSSALSVEQVEHGEASEVTLYLPNVTIGLARNHRGAWAVTSRDEHRLGRVPVVKLSNRRRGSAADGRSEISPAVRSLTDHAVRTLLGMETNREFFSAPQRYGLGIDDGAFTDSDGNVKTGWEAVIGRFLAIPRDEDGELPQVGQFPQSQPGPYLEQIRGLAALLGAEASIPQNYLGFTTENAPSADAIRAMETRLIKRAERRQQSFGLGWLEVARLSILIRDGKINPDEFAQIASRWGDPATPTRSAAADEVTKLVGAGILPADSPVVYDRIGLTAQEKLQVMSDRRRAAASERLTALAEAAAAARQTPEVVTMDGARDGDRG